MKVGSLVECIDNSNFIMAPIPKLKQPYTVSKIGTGTVYLIDGTLSDKTAVFIMLEELSSGDVGYDIKYFRELLPPMEIQSALDSCEKILIEK